MTYQVFCLYASVKGEEPSPCLIAAEDEYSWEGDPSRCEAVFKAARDLAERNDWEVREITLTVDIEAVCRAFEPTEIVALLEDEA